MNKIRIRRQIGIHNMIFEFSKFENLIMAFKYTYDGKKFYSGRKRKIKTTQSGRQYFLFNNKKIYVG